ncbi:IS3 family transposase [Terribacillus sp. 179-K 1B1 HS]
MLQEVIAEGFSTQLVCEIAGIARSSYYKWLKRVDTPLDIENMVIEEEMRRLHTEHNGIYGYRRMRLYIQKFMKKPINHKRIYRLMNKAKLVCVIRKKRPAFIKSTPLYTAENILNREFQASAPNKKWATDVTEMKYGNKKLYLGAILDLCDGSIVNYVYSKLNNNGLVMNTIDGALEKEPQATPLLHSDRGFQYTSHAFKRRIDTQGMTHSMSRVGRCIDNGPMESFWGALKTEMYYLKKFSTYEELASAIDNYIHFYNTKRLQEKREGLSPLEYRAKAF